MRCRSAWRRPYAKPWNDRCARLGARESPKALYRLFVSTAVRLFILAVAPVVLIALGGPELFKFVFGPSWEEAGLYVQLLAPIFILRFVVAPISSTLFVLERQGLALAVTIARFVVTIGTLLVAGLLNVAPPTAVALYSASMALAYVGLFMIMLYALDSPPECNTGTNRSRDGKEV